MHMTCIKLGKKKEKRKKKKEKRKKKKEKSALIVRRAPRCIDTSLLWYSSIFADGAVQEATVTPNANNNFHLGTSGPNNHGHIIGGYIGHTLGNFSPPVSVFD